MYMSDGVQKGRNTDKELHIAIDRKMDVYCMQVSDPECKWL